MQPLFAFRIVIRGSSISLYFFTHSTFLWAKGSFLRWIRHSWRKRKQKSRRWTAQDVKWFKRNGFWRFLFYFRDCKKCRERAFVIQIKSVGLPLMWRLWSTDVHLFRLILDLATFSSLLLLLPNWGGNTFGKLLLFLLFTTDQRTKKNPLRSLLRFILLKMFSFLLRPPWRKSEMKRKWTIVRIDRISLWKKRERERFESKITDLHTSNNEHGKSSTKYLN